MRATYSYILSNFLRTYVLSWWRFDGWLWLQNKTPSAFLFLNVFKCFIVFTVARMWHGKRSSRIRVNLWLVSFRVLPTPPGRSGTQGFLSSFSDPVSILAPVTVSRYLYKTIYEIALWAILTRHYFGTFYTAGTMLFSSKKKKHNRSSSLHLLVTNFLWYDLYELTGS